MKKLLICFLILSAFGCHKTECIPCEVKGHPQIDRVLICGEPEDRYDHIQQVKRCFPGVKVFCPFE